MYRRLFGGESGIAPGGKVFAMILTDFRKDREKNLICNVLLKIKCSPRNPANLFLFSGLILLSQNHSHFANTSSRFRPLSIFQADDTNIEGFLSKIDIVLFFVGMRIENEHFPYLFCRWPLNTPWNFVTLHLFWWRPNVGIGGGKRLVACGGKALFLYGHKVAQYPINMECYHVIGNVNIL